MSNPEWEDHMGSRRGATEEVAISVSSRQDGRPLITIMGDQHDIPLSVAQAKMLVRMIETTIWACETAYREANSNEKRIVDDEGGRITTPLRASSLGSFRPGEYETTSLGFPKPTTQSETPQQTVGLGNKGSGL